MRKPNTNKMANGQLDFIFDLEKRYRFNLILSISFADDKKQIYVYF